MKTVPFRLEPSPSWKSLVDTVAARVLQYLGGAFPFATPGLIPCPAGPGVASPLHGVNLAFMMGAPGSAGSRDMADLELALKFILRLKRQCVLYLYANTKAIEFTSIGSQTVMCEDETEIYKYTGSVDQLFQATFNTFSELLSRDAVHKRVGMRMSAEEYADLMMFDKVHKLIRYIHMVFGMLCSIQSAFKNLGFPGRLETHVQ